MSRLFETRPDDDGLPGRERRIAVLVVVVGTLMAVIDTTMINIALPSIARDLEISAARAVWVVSLFQIVCAATLLLFASLSELVSRRRLYIAGLVVFTLASLGAALANGLEMLLMCRALQGLGAAATLSIGPSIYRLIFPTRLLGAAMGLSALVVAAGYASGPTLGGVILSFADWPWLFALNVPVGLLALALAVRALPAEPRRRGGFDITGALLSAAMLACFFLAMDGAGHQAPWWEVLGLMLASLVAGWLFLRRQRRASHPLLPLSLFDEPRFSLAIVVSGLAFVGQGLAFVALSFLYQQEMGFSPLQTAWLFTPWPLTIMFAAPLAGRLADRFNPALLSTLGLVLLLSGLVALALVPDGAGIVNILWRTALCGLGFGFFQAPNNREMMSSVPKARSNNASGMMSTTRTIGQSLGVALVGVFLALGAGSVQASLWLGCGACALAVAVSLRRIPLAPAAKPTLAERASPGPD
ncbi:MFS transporter, DHA2 family, multidrug resistance protein [Franzmannia pantelleriensis]|uniref:MFS transporter, DHA2 family, multidrug resistance protein n=1 Tax=Franzmannia pantelleriensis TaxID=48727 RepID=A0A1G9QKH7_9GAMM|nr:MFS transporter [Halomonas pantelleriensis]SDM11506.1 MFS transporter, DHA2 family, multidrug resistance protein [Halomonas pantelleriensis]